MDICGDKNIIKAAEKSKNQGRVFTESAFCTELGAIIALSK